jgi:signal transduction histidine kinase
VCGSNAVIGYSSLLCETDLTSDQREAFDCIQSNSARLLTLVNDFLDSSKIQAGALRLWSDVLVASVADATATGQEK